MFATRNEYDRGVNTFSPEGRLFQVEYAIEAIKLGSTAVGVKTKEGVVLVVEKRITSPLLSRPFGVAFLVAGCDADGPVLYHTDPSGTYFRFEAWAIGAGSEGAQAQLQEKYAADMSLAGAEVLALGTLKQVMEEKVTDINVDVATVKPDGFKLYTKQEVAEVISRI